MENNKQKTIEKQKSKIKKLRKQLRSLKSETQRTTITLVTSAFGFVAALFWRDAIKSLLDQTFGVMPGEGYWGVQMIVAIIVTMIAAIVTFSLSKTLE
jgi:F0F1-type ATP synthase assembly protein I